MTTNILTLPLIQVDASTQTNEDWIDGFAFFLDSALTTPIELDGISFDMEVRYLPPDATVVLRGLSDDGTLVVAENTLRMNFPETTMNKIVPADYVFDIVMTADNSQRVLAIGSLTVVLGITR